MEFPGRIGALSDMQYMLGDSLLVAPVFSEQESTIICRKKMDESSDRRGESRRMA
ncbi:MAG: hypothetical protein ACLUOI_06190 [Eisenbergiella sp.]